MEAHGQLSPSRRRVYLMFATTTVTILLLLGIECIARKLYPKEAEPVFSSQGLGVSGRPFVERHPDRGFALKAGYKGNVYRVNSRGFRGAELPRDLAPRFVILALGESSTFGWGVYDGEDYPSRLTKVLHERGLKDAYVVNGGVPSYTSNQVVLYLRELLPSLKPDLVLVSIFWNDVFFSTAAAWHQQLLVHQQPGAMRQYLSKHSGLYRSLMTRSKSREDKVDLANDEALENYRSNVAAMIDLCKERAVPLAFMRPTLSRDLIQGDGLKVFHNGVRYTTSFFLDVTEKYLAAMEKTASQANVSVIDHELTMRRSPESRLFLDFIHPNAAGHLAIAQALADSLIEKELVETSADAEE